MNEENRKTLSDKESSNTVKSRFNEISPNWAFHKAETDKFQSIVAFF